MVRSLLYAGLVILLASGCHHNAGAPEPTLSLPLATATGANTVGFELAGQPWTTYGQVCPFSTPCRANAVLVRGDYGARGVRRLWLSTRLTSAQRDEEFVLQLDSIGGPGIYACSPSFTGLVSPIPTGFGLRNLLAADPAQQHAASVASSSRIVLTRVDTVQRVIAGTFEGQVRQGGPPAVVTTVQHGRFDVHY